MRLAVAMAQGGSSALPQREPGLAAARRIRLEEVRRWDEFVEGSAQANPCSLGVWSEAFGECLGYGSDVWIVARGEEWMAGVRVFRRRRLHRPACVSPPQTFATTVVYSPQLSCAGYPSKVTAAHLEVTKALVQGIAAHYSAVHLDLLPSVTDVRPWQWAGWRVTPSYTYLIDLTAQVRVTASVRKHVRKCEENLFVFSTRWNPDDFIQLVSNMTARQGVRIGIREDRLVGLVNRLRGAGCAWMATAYTAAGHPVASRIEVHVPGGNTLFDWIAGSDSAYLASGANAWLMTKIAEEARQRGFTLWNLCGANFENIARFKSDLGGELVHGWSVASPEPLTGPVFTAGRRCAAAARRFLMQTAKHLKCL